MFLKDSILTKQVHRKSVIFATIYIFLNKGFTFQPYICNKGHDLLTISMNLCDITILNIKGLNYCCIIGGISKSEATKLLRNIDLTEKSVTL